MKRRLLAIIIMLSLFSVVLAESNSFITRKLDWYSRESASKAPIPEGLSEREIEIYRAGYADGHYDALHPAFVEGLYVLNTKTKKFHLSNCMNTLLILSENREHTELSSEILMNEGYKGNKYKPCGECHPER